jgi:fatty-acyl-CoA synthase
VSILARQMFAAAAASPHALTAGTAAEPVRLPWAEVHQQARRMAGWLAAQGIGPGSSVAVLAADAGDVAPLIQAIWMRRGAFTMLQQPTPRMDLTMWLEDTARAIRMLNADIVVVGEPYLLALDHLAAQGFTAYTVNSTRHGSAVEALDADETDIAMRQLTSGSTGVPKAVEISHANVAANTVAMRTAVDLDIDRDVLLSWLPLSHDMGMVAFLLVPMQLGIEAIVVTPDQFVRRPVIWAELITRHRATMTAGPNFAYSVLARVLDRVSSAEIDLSSLRVAVNGAEPIDHRDLTHFVTAGARFGLRPSVPTPAYGMAEATLAVSFGALEGTPTVDSVSRDAVTARQHASPVSGDDDQRDDVVQKVVCVGSPVAGIDLRITRAGKTRRPREIGHIEIRGPAVAARYLTENGFVPLAGADGWFDTGDMGYLDEVGRVYVCGRAKDLIVLRGKNLYPNDIERAAASVDGVRKGCVIALRVDGDAQREGFAVLAEAHGADDAGARPQLIRQIVARVSSQIGHSPRHVLVLPAGTLPKTPSGKLRRTAARQLLTETRT